MSGELLNLIWRHLDCEVSSACLGLTCQKFYPIHRSLHGAVSLTARLPLPKGPINLMNSFTQEVREMIFKLLPPLAKFSYALTSRDNYTEYCQRNERFNILTSTRAWGWDHQWHWRYQGMASRRKNWENRCLFTLLEEWKGPDLILHSYEYPRFVSMERYELDGGDEPRPPVTRNPAHYAPNA